MHISTIELKSFRYQQTTTSFHRKMDSRCRLSHCHSIILPLIVTLISVLPLAQPINIIYQKKNIRIPEHSSHLYKISLNKQNANLIPSYVDMEYSINNYYGTSSNYFDFFYYVSNSDIDCYKSAIGNESYLFPCTFLSNNYAMIRVNQVVGLSGNGGGSEDSEEIEQIQTQSHSVPQSSSKQSSSEQSLQGLTSGSNSNSNKNKLQISKLQDLTYTFIIDNTKFPFPIGSYPYDDIFLNVKTKLQIDISSSYEILAIRLIAINITVLLIFVFIIGCLLWKDRKLKRIMSYHNQQQQKQSSKQSPNSHHLHHTQQSMKRQTSHKKQSQIHSYIYPLQPQSVSPSGNRQSPQSQFKIKHHKNSPPPNQSAFEDEDLFVLNRTELLNSHND